MKKVLLFMCLLVASLQQVFSQAQQISGKVTDRSGEALIGVSVLVKGTTTGAATDLNGNFKISVPSAASVLVFKYIGFTSQEVSLAGRTAVNIVLEAEQTSLNEVVVIGYGTVKRRDLTGSVASVSGAEIASTPVPNAAQAMQGKLPGVKITAQDGRPGADIAIRVRGGGSISQSNQPLILVDGIPGNLADISGDQIESIDVLKDASSTAIYGARGANGVVLVTTKSAKAGKTTVSYSGYAKINTPTKYLESLAPYDYLKYVWANTAANGVAYQTPFEKYYGIGANAGANTGGIESYRNLASDDIQKQVYNESVSWNHALTLTGGTDKTKILFSVNYTDDQGMKINSYYKRANAALKLTQKLRENLTFDFNTRYTRTPTLGDEGTTSGSGSVLSTSYRFRPIATSHVLGDLDAVRTGNIEQYGKNSMWDNYSPVARIGDYEPYSMNQNAVAITSLNWDIIKGLTYHTDFSLNTGWNQRKYWSGAIYNNYIEDATGTVLHAGAADYRKSDSWNLRWTNTLNYHFNLNESHKLNVLVGQEVANSGGTVLAVQANRFPANFDKETAFAQINQYDASVGSAVFSSNVSFPNRMSSYFARANYSLLDRYLLTFTFRADGSSTFGPNNKWGYFPAAAFAWRVSDEPFLSGSEWLDNLKLRVSYGEAGNDRINPSLFTQNWGSVTDQRNQYAINNVRQGAYEVSGTQANPDLKWETTITRNIGTDFGLFKNRLSGTIDLYWNSTRDLLTGISIPGITGFSSTTKNVGQTSNKGIELSLAATIFRNDNWRISAGGNINFNKSNIDELAPGVTGLYGTNWNSAGTYPVSDYILMEGEPVGLVRGLTYDGFYTPEDFTYNNGLYTLKPGVADLGAFMGIVHGLSAANRPAGQTAYPGLPKFRDFDNSGKIDDKDLDVIGRMAPIHSGGFNFDVGYKNFDLAMNFNWSYGNDVYNVTKLATLYGPKEAGVYENKLAIMNNAYKIYDVVGGQLVRLNTPEQLNAANVNSTLPLAYSEGGPTSTLGIEDGSFLRLNTLTLGYRLPKSLLSSIKLSNLYLYGSVYNLLTLTGYSGLDPEVSSNEGFNNQQYPTVGMDFGSYPRARSFVFGMNVNF
ncbi:TonB-linked SusC/RagA family outer membrane protein [Arcticibacter pallidicorallinus]|uniref:TonB-linked SusC/RagA family outer membrane protein n=1 Tax=Arcticibacter pallidicorallinus TaxID=1259464 RepID=A0A2T0U430_9SPHI|nr:TonB-dependent receptor [Arcticibacter pallidicorallinus]PRY52662.1 TonB-linked SusC/RagA family outer membrane protein [Arcticibacter pallidicorallinus]